MPIPILCQATAFFHKKKTFSVIFPGYAANNVRNSYCQTRDNGITWGLSRYMTLQIL